LNEDSAHGIIPPTTPTANSHHRHLGPSMAVPRQTWGCGLPDDSGTIATLGDATRLFSVSAGDLTWTRAMAEKGEPLSASGRHTERQRVEDPYPVLTRWTSQAGWDLEGDSIVEYIYGQEMIERQRYLSPQAVRDLSHQWPTIPVPPTTRCPLRGRAGSQWWGPPR
jgi:hypothetical protein